MRQYNLEKRQENKQQAEGASLGWTTAQLSRLGNFRTSSTFSLKRRLSYSIWLLAALVGTGLVVWLLLLPGLNQTADGTATPDSHPVPHLGVLYLSSKVDVNNPSVQTGAEGLVVTEVKPGSPASRAGILPGDLLIKVDNRVVKAEDSLLNLLADYHASDTVRLEVLRDGKPLSFSVTLN
ncbi:MAG TPA: PDZ domain-containing protein [Chloroflexia bacterium]|nr:PDZ domain-containing protein [Chloroflexia bacterium]